MKKLQYVSPKIVSEITIPYLMAGAPASAPAGGTTGGGGEEVPTYPKGAPKIA